MIARPNSHLVLHKETSKQHFENKISIKHLIKIFGGHKLHCRKERINNLFLHQSYIKSPLPVKLTWWKMQKNHFFSVKRWKNTSSAQLCRRGRVSKGTTTMTMCWRYYTIIVWFWHKLRPLQHTRKRLSAQLPSVLEGQQGNQRDLLVWSALHPQPLLWFNACVRQSDYRNRKFETSCYAFWLQSWALAALFNCSLMKNDICGIF